MQYIGKTSILLFVIFFTSCEESFLDPQLDNTLQESDLWTDPEYAEGIIAGVYLNLPANHGQGLNMACATDNAVSSNPRDISRVISNGGWSANMDPYSKWYNAYKQLYYLNLFLENGLDISYSERNPQKDKDLRKRLKGEAYFLRAYFQWQLLQYHGGKGADGVIYGFPIVTTTLDAATDDLNLPRNTVEECAQQIINDCDTAFAYLPAAYEGGDGIVGERSYGRASGNAALALKSRTATLVASPAFTEGDNAATVQSKWERAARYSMDCISAIGDLDSTGVTFYYPGDPPEYAPSEFIMRAPRQNSWNTEWAAYPPSLNGTAGFYNPTQNLVDAFPMMNGYPIQDLANSGYNLGEPYSNRDPRFNKYILFNGAEIQDININTSEGGLDAEGITTATRTSYYLRKLINEDVVITLNGGQSKIHLIPLLRQTEVYLNYAEAANEAYGPDNNSLGLSSLEVVNMIRDRAGITSDEYMNQQASAGKDAFRGLIQNERRLELCFEGFYFWDIRRWKKPINVMTYGMSIVYNPDHQIGIYSVIEVERKDFSDYMYYGPIPYGEMLKVSNLVQNEGW